MATLDQTLRVFQALLDDAATVGVGEADEAIWAYLIPIPGLHAQRDALAMLRQRTGALNGTASFKARLLEDLDRHERRLSARPV